MERLIIPAEKPLFRGLNSFYIDVTKFIEHFKENSFTGCVHFRSFQDEAAVFYDSDEILGIHYRGQTENLVDEEALRTIVELSRKNSNFSIDVYEIDPDQIYFWANLPFSETIYRDLNAEFTDLEGLIKKMSVEKLSGYITVSLGNGAQGGFILFHNGTVLPQIFFWKDREMTISTEGPERLFQRSRTEGGVFHVKRVSNFSRQAHVHEFRDETLKMIEELLGTMEQLVASNRKYRHKFDTFLKKKFLDKSERFECLDPFMGEFTYENHKVSYHGDAPPSELAKGVCESMSELAEELGLAQQFASALEPWARTHEKRIRATRNPYFLAILSSSAIE
ncbi:MAG: hypothetical protein ACLFQR_01030 [Desulfovibrionales bacterium]